ncbi:MAG TPA: tRNA (adenine-N1)-methyltransferase [Acidimicrobiia bacterium]|jgi:tRNA (adenine57-N1/adenine58-N1)-methyltransferase catalytic subunit|nr:tRNA (adenine-N1)-methyltransferase [Acidimicrobiia bacterium]HIL45676.1 tRNA (adenine-N1)-methyltransferase [Acidimicrobiia bacterium]
MSNEYSIGDHVLLVDRKKRRYLITLESGGEFHSHTGVVSHDDLIGNLDGTGCRSSRGENFLAVRPTMSDFILKMPRGAQVIYPKDLGPILMMADLFPGARVLESGIGSGALSMTMLRAGVDIVGYEIREDFAQRAQENVTAVLGTEVMDRYKITIGDVYQGIAETNLDRVILDLPEPWQVVPHAVKALRPGGIILAYTPSIVQAVTFREALTEHGFAFAETVEVLNRTWHIEPPAVRPDHRMVAHTAFLTHARMLPS